MQSKISMSNPPISLESLIIQWLPGDTRLPHADSEYSDHGGWMKRLI